MIFSWSPLPRPGGGCYGSNRSRAGGPARICNAALRVARLVQAAIMACGVRLDCDVLLPCGHHEKIVNRL